MPLDTALRFAYDGACFEGYQRQPGHRTVEGALIEALRPEGLLEGKVRTGSRTDRGVSALENVVGCRLDRPHVRGLVPALNTRLPDGVWATGACLAPEGWNPRHHALRTYAYRVRAAGEDLARMQAACQAFTGRHDMRRFARLEPGRDPMRDVRRFDVEPAGLADADGDRMDEWLFHCSSPGFLWNQVRRMVSAALAVGRRLADVTDIKDALAGGPAHKDFRLAPPEGLLLESVRYGLEWDPKAGTVLRRYVHGPLQAARHRLDVLQHLHAGGR